MTEAAIVGLVAFVIGMIQGAVTFWFGFFLGRKVGLEEFTSKEMGHYVDYCIPKEEY